MVVIITIHTSDMQSDISRLGETMQSMGDHLSTKRADFLTPEPQVNHRPRPTGEVYDGPGQGFVEGCVAAAETRYAGAGSEGGVKCAA